MDFFVLWKHQSNDYSHPDEWKTLIQSIIREIPCHTNRLQMAHCATHNNRTTLSLSWMIFSATKFRFLSKSNGKHLKCHTYNWNASTRDSIDPLFVRLIHRLFCFFVAISILYCTQKKPKILFSKNKNSWRDSDFDVRRAKPPY